MIRAITAVFVVTLAACATTPEPAAPLTSLSGVQLYERSCASCHGVKGLGDGPVAPLIKIPVPDLTRMGARNGGEFPREAVRLIIDGRQDRRAHGPRDMPVWGWSFYDATSQNDATARANANAMIERLVDYLQSIQRE